MTTSFKFLQRKPQWRMSHLPAFSEWLFDVTIGSTIKKITSLLIGKKKIIREVVRIAKHAQDSLDKYSSFKQRQRKKRDGQEARDKERRPKKEAKWTLFSLKHGQLRIKQWAAGNVDTVKVYKRDLLVNKAKEEQGRLHYRLVLM